YAERDEACRIRLGWDDEQGFVQEPGDADRAHPDLDTTHPCERDRCGKSTAGGVCDRNTENRDEHPEPDTFCAPCHLHSLAVWSAATTPVKAPRLGHPHPGGHDPVSSSSIAFRADRDMVAEAHGQGAGAHPLCRPRSKVLGLTS